MHLSTTAALTALALGCSVPACAWDDWEGETALRLPGEHGVQAWTGPHSLTLRSWAHDLSERLALMARPNLPAPLWRVEGAPAHANRAPAGRAFVMERTRTAFAAHWRPWTVGSWKLGAAMGLHRALPHGGNGAPGFAAMPMASYERAHFRLNLGLVPPAGDRASALLLGLTIPLR